MTNYDYTPVPSYVAPTQGNMEQAATQIANWLRTKGNGKDVRESLAQAVQLFGDVATQFISEASGLKGQFNSAIANANNNTEIQAARTSTVSGTGYTTLGARLDAIDALTANVSKDHTQTASNTNDITGLSADLTQLQTNVNAGLPTTTGVSTSNITCLNGTSINSGGYEIIDFKNFRIIKILMNLNLSISASHTKLLTFPFALQTINNIQTEPTGGMYLINWVKDGTVNFMYHLPGDGHGYDLPSSLDLQQIFIIDK